MVVSPKLQARAIRLLQYEIMVDGGQIGGVSSWYKVE
jgi:hypothetical protein